MKGTGAKRNVCPGSCVSTGATFPVAPVESAPMIGSSPLKGWGGVTAGLAESNGSLPSGL